MSIFNWFGKKKLDTPLADPRGTLALKRKVASLALRKTKLVVLEAGASGGEDTFEWAALSEIETVYAFEPEPKSFQVLSKGAAKYGNKIQCFQKGLARVSGESELFVSENENAPDNLAVSSSLNQPEGHLEFHPSIKFKKGSTISILNLDEWAEQNDVKKIDIAWLDMQGSEFDVLESSPKILDTIDVIFTEVSLLPMYSGTPLYPQYRAWLESRGFIVHEEFLPWKDMGNVLFVRGT